VANSERAPCHTCEASNASIPFFTSAMN
jgi:hypothetical protein